MTKEEIKKSMTIKIEFENSGDAQDLLDGLVHDEMSRAGSNINNEGSDAQIDFLVESGFTLEELQKELGL